MNIKIILSLITAGLFMGSLTYADHDSKHEHKNHDHGKNHSHKHMEMQKKKLTNQAVPSKNEIIVKVDGLVCSFCAYGTEKNLSKVDFIDKSYFGGDGVLVEVEEGFVKVSIKDTQSTDLRELVKAITKGGYVAKEMLFWVTGSIIQDKDVYTLEKTNYPYSFELLDFDKKFMTNKQVVLLVKHDISKKYPKGKIPINIEKIELSKK